MNRNQKIALGCGGAGCLGLIVVAIAGGLIFYFGSRSSSNTNRSQNSNSNSNRSINRSSDSNTNTNTSSSDSNTNTNTSSSDSNTNTDTSSSDSDSPSSSLSDDAKHRLFQAAGMTKDAALIQRVLKKIGFMREDGTPMAGYENFVKDHIAWAIRNLEFVNSVNTPEKARAYVDEHIND